MITVRKSEDRGHFDHGWLDTYHTFSFADYYHPEFEGFRSLRVINEDRVRPGEGFGTHPHRDMEILTIVLEGAIEHRDSMGSHGILRPGEVQRMSAGTGVLHSEFNPSRSDPLHLYQIWIRPGSEGVKPEYEQKEFPDRERRGRLRVVASPDGREGSLRIHQDASVYTGLLERGDLAVHAPGKGRHAWLQVARGEVTLNGAPLKEGDGAAASGEPRLEIEAKGPSEVILFDLA